MPSTYEHLVFVEDNIQKSIVEQSLEAAKVPWLCKTPGVPSAILGESYGAIHAVEFQVPGERLEEARDILCSAGLVCRVSDRLLARTLEEIVEPLLASSPEERKWNRLTHALSINNRETVRALLRATREKPGGQALLEQLFFELARENSGELRLLIAVLREDTSDAFDKRFLAVGIEGEPNTRAAIIDALPEWIADGKFHLAERPDEIEILCRGLLDPNATVRDAASEALFSYGIDDRGYEPDADEAARVQAVGSIRLQLER